METKVGELQALLNNRASKRLDKDIAEIERFVSGNRLLNGSEKIKLSLLSTEKDSKGGDIYFTDSLDRLLNEHWGELRNRLYKVYMPEYIQQETENFVNRIDVLQSELDDLKNNMDDLPY